MSHKARVVHWVRSLAERPIKEACFPYFVAAARWASRAAADTEEQPALRLGVVCEELFRADPSGFGGYGQTVENIAAHYPCFDPRVSVVAMLPNKSHLTRKASIENHAGTDCLLVPSLPSLVASPVRYARALRSMRPSLLLAIDYLTQYEYVLWALPECPLIIYLRDPRAIEEWGNVASVPLEIAAAGRTSKAELQAIAGQHRASFNRVDRWSRLCNRKVIFATNAHFLVDRARRKFGIPDLDPYYLPNPIPIPDNIDDHDDAHPTLLVLGRVEPQKRPWVVLELARRLPRVRFVLAGGTRFPELMRDTLDQLSQLPNVELLGMVEVAERARLLKSCWALLNTSSHEGFPVSFQEAFSFGKPVISGQNPDGLVTRHGYFAGESTGEGLDEASVNGFARSIAECINDPETRRQKGRSARAYVVENHSFANFDRHLRALMRAENVAPLDWATSA